MNATSYDFSMKKFKKPINFPFLNNNHNNNTISNDFPNRIKTINNENNPKDNNNELQKIYNILKFRKK